MSCDTHGEIPSCIANIVVALVDVYGDSWLAWLSEVCNHELPVPLLAFIEHAKLYGIVARVDAEMV